MINHHIGDIVSRHRSVERMLRNALLLSAEPEWWEFAAIANFRLDTRERVGLAFGALNALNENELTGVLELFRHGAGSPIPALFTDIDAASMWADMATESEKMAYALAAFNTLSSQNQRAFLDHVTGRAAA